MEPRHHGTEFFTDLFERMFSVLTAHSQEVSAAAGFVFKEPIFGESAGLDVVEDARGCHLGACAGPGDDERLLPVPAR